MDPSEAGCVRALDDGIGVLCVGIDVMAFRRACEYAITNTNAAVAASDIYTRPEAPVNGFPER